MDLSSTACPQRTPKWVQRRLKLRSIDIGGAFYSIYPLFLHLCYIENCLNRHIHKLDLKAKHVSRQQKMTL